MNSKHLTTLMIILLPSLILVHATRIQSVSNQSERIVRRDLRTPPIQHVYPRVNKARQFQAHHQSIQTTTTKPQEYCDCNRTFLPVCGSNGKSFTNECFLNCAAKNDASLQIVSNGICRSVERANRPHLISANNNRRQQSQSQMDCTCPEIYNPICGSNEHHHEQTYPNICAFTCEKRKHPSVRLRITHRGECIPRRMASTIPPHANT